jgi:hypothetical protein
MPVKLCLQLRLCCVRAAAMLRLRHFDETNMLNYPASFTILCLFCVCSGSEKCSIDAAQTQHRRICAFTAAIGLMVIRLQPGQTTHETVRRKLHMAARGIGHHFKLYTLMHLVHTGRHPPGHDDIRHCIPFSAPFFCNEIVNVTSCNSLVSRLVYGVSRSPALRPESLPASLHAILYYS